MGAVAEPSGPRLTRVKGSLLVAGELQFLVVLRMWIGGFTFFCQLSFLSQSLNHLGLSGYLVRLGAHREHSGLWDVVAKPRVQPDPQEPALCTPEQGQARPGQLLGKAAPEARTGFAADADRSVVLHSAAVGQGGDMGPSHCEAW